MKNRLLVSIAGNRGLQISIAGSFVWHVLMVLMFSSVVVVDAGQSDKESEIAITYFIAPMRDQTLAFNKEWLVTKPVKTKGAAKISLPVREYVQDSVFDSASGLEFDKELLLAKAEPKDIKLSSDISHDIFMDPVLSSLPKTSKLKVKRTELFTLAGVRVMRQIVHRPPVPVYPRWAEKQGREFGQVLKFVITSEGEVKDVQVSKSSGSVDIDTLCADFVRKWKFEKIGPQDTITWYKMRVKFRLSEESK